MRPLEVISRFPRHDYSLAGALDARAAVVGAHEFVSFEGRAWTYSEIRDEALRAAAMLAARGVKAQDRIGVMSQNHPSTVVLLLALARLGAIMVPVNPDYGVEEAKYVLTHAGVTGVIASPAALDIVRQAVAELQLSPWLMLNRQAEVPLPVFSEEVARADAATPAHSGTADSTCLFIYTSGTTGFPKGVMHSQRNVILAGEGFVERMHIQPEERLLAVLPLFHINAILYSMSGALAAGATLVLAPRFSASTFWTTVAQTGATLVNTIAAVTAILMRRPRGEYVAGHALRKLYGAPFTTETFEVFQKEFHVPHLIEGYGMSEIPGALCNPFPGPHKIGSMGPPCRHPDPSIRLAELRIVDDQGNEVADGVSGELLCRTPMAMQGYFRDPEQTRAAFRDGWFVTGDLARRDADGYFWFVARKKDIIRRRGENISGAELDRVIGSHPDVLEAAAIAVPAELGEDEILVAAVPRPGATLTAQAIAEWASKHLAPIKVPRYVAIVEELPHTPTHRVAKFRMKGDRSLIERAVDLEKR